MFVIEHKMNITKSPDWRRWRGALMRKWQGR